MSAPSTREELELRLAEGGAAALAGDAELRAWVENDDEAVALLEAFVVLDQCFATMADATGAEHTPGSEHEDAPAVDAPDELVATLLARPELQPPAASEENHDSGPDETDTEAGADGADPEDSAERGRLLTWLPGSERWDRLGWRGRMAVAALTVLAVGAGFLWPLYRAMDTAPDRAHIAQEPRFQAPRSEAELDEAELDQLHALGYIDGGGIDDGTSGGGAGEAAELRMRRKEMTSDTSRAADAPAEQDSYNQPVDQLNRQMVQLQEEQARREPGRSAPSAPEPEPAPASSAPPESQAKAKEESFEEKISVVAEAPVIDPEHAATSLSVSELELADIPTPRDPWAVSGQTPGVAVDRIHVGGNALGQEGSKDARIDEADATVGDTFGDVGARGDTGATDALKKRDADTAPDDTAPDTAVDEKAAESTRDHAASLAAAQRFLDERGRIDGHTFVDAVGYWRNPWLPGDPELRVLAAELDDLASALPAGLHRLARRPSLPLDPPTHDALSLHVHGDRAQVNGPSRLAVRVGLRAADAWAGRRTAMNLAVILHVPAATEIPADTAAILSALLDALATSHDVGDRFSLWVAGPVPSAQADGPLVPADAFRRGSVMLAAQQLLDPEAAPDDDQLEWTDLFEVLPRAGASVLPGAEDSGPVGSSAVLVVTLGEEWAGPYTVETAHRLAVGGVRTSVVAVGVGADPDAHGFDELAAAGQGSRRLVTRPADALPAVEDELARASRAVARAVRLRIRPAPGVRLIGVYDSEPLNAAASERVRQAEQAVDRRLARKLGIEADRGDDEEGIQIVIPALYAGDAVSVMLDVVVPGPGPVVDVTARFKDLVRLDNGVARARLDLDYGEPSMAPEGPLEVSVLRSLLAHDTKERLLGAAEALSRDHDIDDALRALQDGIDLLRGMERMVPALADDTTWHLDLRMLAGYVDLLSSRPDTDLDAVASSLHYASKLKTLPRPDAADSEPRR